MQNISTIEKKLKLKPYTTTRIKAARHFLSNIAYNSVNDQEIFNRNVCFNMYDLVIKKSQSVFFLPKQEQSLTKASKKQSVCSGKILCQMNFNSLSVTRKL